MFNAKHCNLNQMISSSDSAHQTSYNLHEVSCEFSDDEILKGFERLHRKVYPTLFSYVNVVLRDEKLSNDLIGLLFIDAWENNSILRNIPDLRLYFFQSARHHCIALLQASEQCDAGTNVAEQPTIEFVEEDFEEEEFSDKQVELFNVLLVSEREIVYLERSCDLNLCEVALITGKSFKSILALSASARRHIELSL